MRICAAWLLKHAVAPKPILRKPPVFTSGRCSLTPILQLLGRGFLARTRSFTLTGSTPVPPGARRRNVLWRMRRDWSLTRLKPCSPWVIINTGCCVITGLPKPRSSVSAKRYQAAARHPCPRLGCPTRGTLGSKHCLLRASPRPGPTECGVTQIAAQTYASFDNSRPR